MRARASAASTWLLLVVVSLVTAAVYLPVLRAGFVDWDDTTLLVHNAAYRGFSAAHLRWMLTSDLLGHYAPITWLSFALDYVIWGLSPFGFHLTNLLLHAVNAGLVVLVAQRLFTEALALSRPATAVGAGTTALFFALHPLRVESVAWIPERRGLLSALFVLVSVLAYLDAAREPTPPRRRRLLVGSVAAFALALGAKASAMTLPAVLLLLDVYPLRRVPADPRRWLTRSSRDVWLEKVPYAILAAVGVVVAYVGQSSGADAALLTPSVWLTKVARAPWFYAYRTLVPVHLSPLYELPSTVNVAEPRILLGVMGATGLTLAAWVVRRSCPGILAAWVFEWLMLAPFIGLTHVGYQLFADRYSYLPGLGWALLGGAVAAVLVRAWSQGGLGPPAAGLGVAVGMTALLALATLTTRQIAVWQDPVALWTYAVAVEPDCSICHAQLGTTLLGQGAPEAALAHFERTLVLRPDRVRVRIPMAEALVQVGRLDEAVAELRRVLDRYPAFLPGRLLLAETLVRLGRPDQAAAELREAAKAVDPGEAVTYLARMRAREPNSAVVRAGLVYAYLALDRPDLARAEREALERLTPDAARLAGPRAP